MSIAVPATLVELAELRAETFLHTAAYTFISRIAEKSCVTFSQLDTRARAIAATLLDIKAKNQRALLLYVPGLDYIEAFFGCLYAGVVAVPAYPPDPTRLSRTLPRLQNIIDDSQAYVIMSTSSIESLAKDMFIQGDKQAIKWLSTDLIPDSRSSSWKTPKIHPKTIAFLQYTSGSTSNPKGVILTHQNLFANLELIEKEVLQGANHIGVSWLPPYHDMGLIGGILHPMFANFPVVLMSPLDFLSQPLLWLKAISEYKATFSGAPNFAYELCVKRITPAQRDILDLSSWSVAANGAEPIRQETMENFSAYFAASGFKKAALFPCYGLAETTLYVCGGNEPGLWSTIAVDAKSLENGVVNSVNGGPSRTLVGCGRPRYDQEIRIVDKDKKISLRDCCVGEIWLKHPSVAQGYFRQIEKSKETFAAFLSDGSGPFLRTGDLGFLKNGELFITGRQKDLIIIRGRNHYPQDIEKTVEEAHSNIRFGCVAAFSTEQDDHENLVIVAECKNPQHAEETIAAIAKAIVTEHGLNTNNIFLIEAKSIPKTSSGKIQRHACKEMFKNGTLDIVSKKSPLEKGGANSQIEACVVQVLGLAPNTLINPDEPLVSFGLDSLMRQELIGALENLIQHPLTDLAIDEKTTVNSLVKYLKSNPASANISLTSVSPKTTTPSNIPTEYARFDQLPGYLALKAQFENLEMMGIKNPYFTEHEGLVRDTTTVHGHSLINFSNYNYIGMAGHPEVSAAAKDAIDTYGTSVSASRLVSGERPLHVALEKKIAQWIGVEDAIVYVSGHGTNVSTIGHLFEQGDLIVHDSLSHNSILLGCQLSKAKSMPFPHNDWQSLDRILAQHRHQYKRVLIVIEGIYSMDGDIPDLAKYIEIKQRHQAFLMVDEAHSIGVLGKTGRGLAEHAHVSPKDVDLWMGTLSKSFASCGGYIAGCKAVVEYLRYSSPGFVYSVGLSPPNAAASLKSLEILEKEPERVQKLKNNSKLFLSLCKQNQLDMGLSADSPIIPIIIGNSIKALLVSEKLVQSGINVLPIIYPAVEDHLSRLRFFMTSCHSDSQIRHTVEILSKEMKACASL